MLLLTPVPITNRNYGRVVVVMHKVYNKFCKYISKKDQGGEKMGHRAYIIIETEDGVKAVYSHWGAHYIMEALGNEKDPFRVALDLAREERDNAPHNIKDYDGIEDAIEDLVRFDDIEIEAYVVLGREEYVILPLQAWESKFFGAIVIPSTHPWEMTRAYYQWLTLQRFLYVANGVFTAEEIEKAIRRYREKYGFWAKSRLVIGKHLDKTTKGLITGEIVSLAKLLT